MKNALIVIMVISHNVAERKVVVENEFRYLTADTEVNVGDIIDLNLILAAICSQWRSMGSGEMLLS